MKGFNFHMELFDYAPIINLFREKGELRVVKKRDYFLRQNESSRFIAWVRSGVFQYACVGEDGRKCVVGYCFENEFVCDYASLIRNAPAGVDIQAMTDAEIYLLPYDIVERFWERDMDRQRLGRKIVETMFSEVYQRLLGFYCETPQQRYAKLMQRCPNLKEIVPLKDIASFLGVTPETVSHIRRKLRHE